MLPTIEVFKPLNVSVIIYSMMMVHQKFANLVTILVLLVMVLQFLIVYLVHPLAAIELIMLSTRLVTVMIDFTIPL